MIYFFKCTTSGQNSGYLALRSYPLVEQLETVGPAIDHIRHKFFASGVYILTELQHWSAMPKGSNCLL